MESKQILAPILGWWNDGMFDIFFAIPDGWVISGELALSPEASFDNRKIVRNGGHRFTRDAPFPMIVSRSTSQEKIDSDIGLLISHGEYVTGFVEWVKYGINSAYSLHWTKIHLSDLFKRGYGGRVEATLHVENNPDLDIVAQCIYNVPCWGHSHARPTLELEFFRPQGSMELLESFLHACGRWRWKELQEELT